MRKSDKKFENELRKSLTRLCENEFERLNGFRWLTHKVNYPNIQSSLKVVCVFDTNDNLELFLSSTDKPEVEAQILKVISQLSVKLKNVQNQLVFDSEENCNHVNSGNWAERLA